MIKKFTLRLPSEIATLAAEEAARVGISRHEWIVNLITSTVSQTEFDPDLVIGFVRLTGGEIEPDVLCPQCDNPFGDRAAYVGFTAGRARPEPFGPICEDCADTE